MKQLRFYTAWVLIIFMSKSLKQLYHEERDCIFYKLLLKKKTFLQLNVTFSSKNSFNQIERALIEVKLVRPSWRKTLNAMAVSINTACF